MGRDGADPETHGDTRTETRITHHSMYLRQTLLLLGLVLLSACSQDCLDGQRLKDAIERKTKRAPREELPTPGVPNECPLDLYRRHAGVELRERSLSPWKYELVSLEDHVPSSYIAARCLCQGCIRINQTNDVLHDRSFNSVTITQSRHFWKKTRCADGSGYRLEPVSLDVPVGCTCVRPVITESS